MEETRTGINLIPQEVKNGKILRDKKWKTFTDQELLVISDLVFNYDSGLYDRETCDNIVRGLQTEMFEREI